MIMRALLTARHPQNFKKENAFRNQKNKNKINIEKDLEVCKSILMFLMLQMGHLEEAH